MLRRVANLRFPAIGTLDPDKSVDALTSRPTMLKLLTTIAAASAAELAMCKPVRGGAVLSSDAEVG